MKNLTVLLPIALMLAFPVLLWGLAQFPFNIKQPGLRFKVSSIFTFSTWIAVLIFLKVNYWYWLAGLLFLIAFLTFSFMVWSVLCWGYTIRMLLVLELKSNSIDRLQWEMCHAGPNGIQELTQNRVCALQKLGLIESKENKFTVTKRGLFLDKTAQVLIQLFGVSL